MEEGNNIARFPSETLEFIDELKEQIQKGRRLLGTLRLAANVALKKGRRSSDAEVWLAAADALEEACNQAEAVNNALKKKPLNEHLLEDAHTAKSSLESAIAVAEQYK